MCPKMVEGGGSRVMFRCMLETGHDGPCAANEVSRSIAARNRWLASQEPEPILHPPATPTPTAPDPATLPTTPSEQSDTSPPPGSPPITAPHSGEALPDPEKTPTPNFHADGGLRQREGDQPLPLPAQGPIMHEMLIELFQQRLALGISRYGQPLRAFNGRNSARDALEEAADLLVYLQQSLIERAQMVALLSEAFWVIALAPRTNYSASDAAQAHAVTDRIVDLLVRLGEPSPESGIEG